MLATNPASSPTCVAPHVTSARTDQAGQNLDQNGAQMSQNSYHEISTDEDESAEHEADSLAESASGSSRSSSDRPPTNPGVDHDASDADACPPEVRSPDATPHRRAGVQGPGSSAPSLTHTSSATGSFAADTQQQRSLRIFCILSDCTAACGACYSAIGIVCFSSGYSRL
jgi:hypothetical protein